jgi:crotonobetaine/carnitine-CoA ligase
MQLLKPIETISRYSAHSHTLRSLFETRVQSDPTRAFLQFQNRIWSWTEFQQAIDDTARMLATRGIRRGERVAIVARNSYAHVLLLFALARIRAIMVPVNPEGSIADTRYVLNHAGVKGIVCASDMLQNVRDATVQFAPQPWVILSDTASTDTPNLGELIGQPCSATLPDDESPDDTCLIIYTSGTTGFPKGVMHSQRNFVLCGERHVERTYIQPDERMLCILPMFHINALFYSLAGAVAAGACLIVAPRFSASSFWRFAAETSATQVNILMAVGSILTRRPRSEFVADHKLRLVNGSPFTREMVDVFQNEFGIGKLIEGYGMTEIPGAFSNPYDGRYKIASMGKPGVHPDRTRVWTEARVVDDDFRDLPNDTTGELLVRIPTLMQGYYKDPAQTAAALCDGWFITGDLVRRDDDGYFEFVSRKKDVIRRRGENIAGAELDRVIGELPGVSEVATIPVAADLGEDEILAVIRRTRASTLSSHEVWKWCAERLPPHKIPRYVTFVGELPYTSTHKVAKFLLKTDTTLLARAEDRHALTTARE